jgi:hypothetical protein
LKLLLTVFFFLIIVVGLFALGALILWWLVPAAFPLLAFNYGQALALMGLLTLFALPSLK